MKVVAAENEGHAEEQRRESVPIRPEGRSSGFERSVPPATVAGANDFGATNGRESACRKLGARDNGRKAACGGRGPRPPGESRLTSTHIADRVHR